MKLLKYLEEIESRAINPLDIKNPVAYFYKSKSINTITIDVEIFEKIKILAKELEEKNERNKNT